MKRGDVIVVAVGSEAGRPALVVQSDLFDEGHPSVLLAPITRTLVNAPLFRLTVEPSTANGLEGPSQVMIDKLFAAKRDGTIKPLGHMETDVMARVARSIALWTGLGS